MHKKPLLIGVGFNVDPDLAARDFRDREMMAEVAELLVDVLADVRAINIPDC